jgi:AAHS family 4-hydroxybenzoate transporter-like MFS transporter
MNASTGQHAALSLTALVDDVPLGAYQLLIFSLCALIAMLDGFDTQAIGFVAPAIAAALHVPITDFGPIFAAGLLGGLFGALIFGLLADRLGRKPILGLTVTVFAAGSLLTVGSSSAFELMACRFLTGLGLGGAMPSIISITAEYAPRRLRATLVTAMFCGFPLGAVVGAIGVTRLLPLYGWRVVFILGGALPLILLPLVIAAMPESIRWLAANGRSQMIGRILARMARADLWDGRAHFDEPTPNRSNVTGLFAAGRAAGTVLLWITFFLSLLLVYLLVSWIPTLAQQTGREAGVGTLAAAALNLGGILGSVCLGRLIDRFGPFSVVGLAYLLGSAVVVAIGVGTQLSATIYWFAALVGFFCIGAQLCVVAIASGFYPVALRGTGVGWSMGIGRIGAIAGPLVGGWMIGGPADHHMLFSVLALTSLVAGSMVLVMGRVSRSTTAA